MEVISPPITARAMGARISAPGPEGQGQGQHAEDHGQGGHHDRAQPGPAGGDDGLPALQTPGPQHLGVVHQQDGVLGDQAHQHDEADQGHDVDRVPGQQQHAGHADDGQGQGEHDGQGVDEGLELGGQDQVDEDDGQDQGLGHVAEGFLHLFGFTGKDDPVARGHGQARSAAFLTVWTAVPRGSPSRLAETTTSRDRSCRLISEGVVRRS